MKMKIFRYGYSALFVIVGLVISFLVFSYYNAVKYEETQENEDRADLAYANEVYVFVTGETFEPNRIDCEKFDDVIITLTETMVYVDEAGCCYTGDVVLTMDEPCYPLMKGRYPTQTEMQAGERVVVLGQQLKYLTWRENSNDYITLCGDDYKVTGYLGCESSTVLDYAVINYSMCLGEGMREDLADYGNAIGYSLLFQSDTVSEQHIRELLQPYFESDEPFFSEIEENPKFFASRSVSKENKQYAIITYIFSIIIIVLVIEYWFICRRKEFAIRKAFGYTSDRLILRMIAELVLYIVISIIISELLLALFNVFEKRAVIFMVKNFYDRMANLALYAGVTICILLIRPMYTIYSDDPIQLLVDKEKR